MTGCPGEMMEMVYSNTENLGRYRGWMDESFVNKFTL